MNVEETMQFIVKQQARGKAEMAAISNMARGAMRASAETTANINRLAAQISRLSARRGGNGRHSRN